MNEAEFVLWSVGCLVLYMHTVVFKHTVKTLLSNGEGGGGGGGGVLSLQDSHYRISLPFDST